MNPHKLLGLNKEATKADIIKAAARALQERKHPALDVAWAQRRLLDPQSNAKFSFVCFLDFADWRAIDALLGENLFSKSGQNGKVPLFERLGVFDD